MRFGLANIYTWLVATPHLPLDGSEFHLRDQAEVARLYEILHGQTIQAAADTILVTVTNDLKEHRHLQGIVSRRQT